MLTTKERAVLRKHAHNLDPILHVGKNGVSSTVLKQLNDALDARELVKGVVQENLSVPARDVAQELAEAAECDIVQVIGKKFVLYKKRAKDPIYNLKG